MKRVAILVLEHVIKEITPEIRSELAELIDNLEIKAKQTPNKFDDFFIKILRWVLLGIDES